MKTYLAKALVAGLLIGFTTLWAPGVAFGFIAEMTNTFKITHAKDLHIQLTGKVTGAQMIIPDVKNPITATTSYTVGNNTTIVNFPEGDWSVAPNGTVQIVFIGDGDIDMQHSHFTGVVAGQHNQEMRGALKLEGAKEAAPPQKRHATGPAK